MTGLELTHLGEILTRRVMREISDLQGRIRRPAQPYLTLKCHGTAIDDTHQCQGLYLREETTYDVNATLNSISLNVGGSNISVGFDAMTRIDLLVRRKDCRPFAVEIKLGQTLKDKAHYHIFGDAHEGRIRALITEDSPKFMGKVPRLLADREADLEESDPDDGSRRRFVSSSDLKLEYNVLNVRTRAPEEPEEPEMVLEMVPEELDSLWGLLVRKDVLDAWRGKTNTLKALRERGRGCMCIYVFEDMVQTYRVAEHVARTSCTEAEHATCRGIMSDAITADWLRGLVEQCVPHDVVHAWGLEAALDLPPSGTARAESSPR